MFFVELKPAANNKDIFNVEYMQQCKIKLEPPKHKREVPILCLGGSNFILHWNFPNIKGILPNVQTANDMGTQKITAIFIRGVSNAPVTT
jgi:hypothetical protein